ncbi:MAG TPA: peptide chain release factor N(5)-glutamine methyltransferase, partial [Anaerolineae bacterium]|nr:peptide chain release factor N(5)-glutamine methyltransferase [Anaerolineae bacterium]
QDRTWLYTHPQFPLDDNQMNSFETLLRRREQREPVAYIVGVKEFFGLEFEVNPHVLIPRPETELLVETVLRISGWPMANGEWRMADLQSKIQNLKSKIVDVGTGSGCIAISLAKNLPDATFLAIDASAEALQLARRNAERHGVADRITFLQGDLLQPLTSAVDLIVSNPPYVSQPELVAAMPEVSRYEPRLALDGGPIGLDVIWRLLAQAREKLNPGGALLMEIGSNQGQGVAQLAKTLFPQALTWVAQDLAGLDRLLIVEL